MTYRAFGYGILTVVGGWVLNLYDKPGWATVLIFTGLLSAVFRFFSDYLTAMNGEPPAEKYVSHLSTTQSSRWARRLSSWSDRILFVLLPLTLTAVFYVAYQQNVEGVKVGFDQDRISEVRLHFMSRSVPQIIVVDVSIFMENTAKRPLAAWVWNKFHFPDDFSWKYQIADPGALEVKKVLEGAAQLSKKDAHGPSVKASEVTIPIPPSTVFTIPAAPTPPVSRPTHIVFTIGHEDQVRFLREVEGFPCCPGLEIAVRETGWSSLQRRFQRQESKVSDCLPTMRSLIAGEYLSALVMQGGGRVDRGIAERLLRVKREVCDCTEARRGLPR